MVKLPEPPAPSALAAVTPERRELPRGTELWRVYFRGGRYPTLWDQLRAFGPTNARFDHHLPPPRLQRRKVIYVAEHGPTCLAEVFQETRTIDRRAREPWLVAFRLRRSVELLDLTGHWPTRAGASMALATGPRARARRWALAIYEAYPWAEGLYYPSSMHANRPAVVLFERAEDTLPRHPEFHRPLVDPALRRMLGKVAFDLGYGLC